MPQTSKKNSLTKENIQTPLGKYNPFEFEKEIYQFWQEKNYFHGEINPDKIPYSIVIPPPNVTGYLHIGHALNNSLQDIMIRIARMKGYSACWIPGTDHAGIATQNVVERELNKQGITRFDLGREQFVKKVWEWKENYGSRIISQLKALGCSCDWQRLRFTLDEDYCKAVTHEFVTLYNNGLIYRGNYMINWCPRCLTAISDIEVEHKQKKGSLWDIKYPLIDEKTGLASKNEFITVSTTRPETMLGDTAVAVNPQDKRYKKYIGRFILLPLAERKIPVIADSYVDMNFGTGALKVTPAHDPNDFELSKKHNLEIINIMDDNAVLNENAGKYKGMERYEARKKIISDLNNMGLLERVRQHVSSIGFCSRCDSVIEPRISNQWFVSMKKLAKPAIEAVKDGKVKFIPKKWEKIYFNWIENIKDWCISRQLWWGHRIPVWYCGDCNETIVSEHEPLKCKCGSKNLIQDSDVLDTWFSSCLWPFASLGWPNKTKELEYYFPTTLLVTGHDIIFFWVARMIMMSLYFMKDVPFKEVFVNPLVNDIYGQKMSKSKGNVIDPLSIIEKFGADSLRFTLASLTTPGKNLLLGEEKIEGSRNFANKIWNASKFVLSNFQNFNFKEELIKSIQVSYKDLDLGLWEKWILSRLSKAVKSIEKYLSKYNMSFACRTLTSFFWNEFCDWYIEISKVVFSKAILFNSSNLNQQMKINSTLFVLWYVLEKYLRLLHPFMPFITEKIWQNIPHEGESIMLSSYPKNNNKILDNIDEIAENKVNEIIQIVSEIRRIRTEQKINPGVNIKASIKPSDENTLKLLKDNELFIKNLAKIEVLDFAEPVEKKGYIKTIKNNSQIFIYLLDVINIDAEIKRILSVIEKLNEEIEKSSKKLSNPQFVSKAPKDIINKEKIKLEKGLEELKVLKEQLNTIKSMQNLR